MLHNLKKFGLFERVARRPPIIYAAFRRILAEAEKWDADQRDAWLRKRTVRTAKMARCLPVYRDRLRSDNISEWPVLKKSDILGQEGAYSNRRIMPSYHAMTGGSTGAPLALLRSPTSIIFEQATIDHTCEKANLVLPRARMAVLRGDFVKSPSDMTPPYSRVLSSRRRLFSSFHLTKGTLAQYVAELREFQPDVLACYPSSLQHLLALLEQGGQSIRMSYVLTSSERLPSDVATAARRILGAHVIDYYGQAERVAFACAIDNSGYFFLPVYGAVELLVEEEGRARVLGTSLWNDHQILVRYDTGDIALIGGSDTHTLNEVRLGIRAFQGIDGRTSERIDLPDGRRIIGLNHIPRGVLGAASIQLYHADPKVVEALVVPVDDYGLETEAAIRQNFYDKFPNDVILRIQKIASPVRTASGKAPLLITKFVRTNRAEWGSGENA
jgi:phenylacetate-CoA ligase